MKKIRVTNCWAECFGYTPNNVVPCDGGGTTPIFCDCDPSLFDPVCVLVDNSYEISFPNACFAECEGFTPNDVVNCGYDPGTPGGCDCDPFDCPM